MSNDIVFVGKKAGFAYFGVIFAVVIALLAAIMISDAASAGSDKAPPWFFVVAIVIVLLGVLKWKSLSSIRWVVHENSLVRHWGFLPWTKREFHYRDEIHEAGYTVGFFKTLFGYSTVWLTTTHGTTQEHSEPYMKDVKTLSAEINKMVRRNKEANATAGASAPSKSAVDEIKDLAALKASGDLSEAEFEMMKAKILMKD